MGLIDKGMINQLLMAGWVVMAVVGFFACYWSARWARVTIRRKIGYLKQALAFRPDTPSYELRAVRHNAETHRVSIRKPRRVFVRPD